MTQRLMKPGNFSLNFKAGTPRSIWAAPAFFDHIVITPTRMQPIATFSDANILANAIYSGVIHTKPDVLSLAGAGLDYWLGTPSGVGALSDTGFQVTTPARSLSSVLNDAAFPDAGTALTPTVGGGGLPSLSNFKIPPLLTPREYLDAICQLYGAEYKMGADGTYNVTSSDALFRYLPNVVVTRKVDGVEGGYRGLAATTLVTASDVAEYITDAWVIDEAGARTVSAGSTSFVDWNNSTIVMRRNINADGTGTASAATLGASVIDQYNAVRRNITLSSDTYTVDRFITPGDFVYVWDQESDLVDPTVQVQWRGELISPIILRVYALTWPLEQGMGVYLRESGATAAYTDLSDYIEWDTSGTQWEVGATARDVTPDTSRAGSPAYLGPNPAVVARNAAIASGAPTADPDAGAWYTDSTNDRVYLADGTGWVIMAEPDQTSTPTLTGMAVGTGGGATNTLHYHRCDGYLDFEWIALFGTSGTTFPTNPTFSLPVAMAQAEAQFDAMYVDTGAARHNGRATTSTAGALALTTFVAAMTGITTTTPITWGAGDAIHVRGRYRMTSRYS